jgi:hypothetical protein
LNRISLLRGAVASWAVLTAVVALSTQPAKAEDATGAGQSVALRSLMKLYPGSVALSSDTIRIAPGMILRMPGDQPRDKPIAGSDVPFQAAPATAARPVPPALAGQGSRKPPEPAQLSARPTMYGCPYYYLCLYDMQNMDYRSYMLGLYYCNFEDLGRWGYSGPGRGHWNDKTRSYVNNQTDNTMSSFHNWDGVSRWVWLFNSYALDWQYSLGANDRIIDGVRVC